jgi:DoxX-like family
MAQEQTQGGPADAVPSKTTIWVGRISSAIPVLMMALSAVMKLLSNPAVVADWGPRFGYPEGTLLAIGAVELACAVLYALPRTAVLGAILVTGYLGGATATHVRIGEAAFVAPVILGILAWGGLFLRDPRLRALLPLRRNG